MIAGLHFPNKKACFAVNPMRKLSLGKTSLILAAISAILFIVHFGGFYPILNSNMIAPIISVLGIMLAVVGYFERDKKKLPAILGVVMNAGFLIWWIVLLIQSLS